MVKSIRRVDEGQPKEKEITIRLHEIAREFWVIKVPYKDHIACPIPCPLSKFCRLTQHNKNQMFRILKNANGNETFS